MPGIRDTVSAGSDGKGSLFFCNNDGSKDDRSGRRTGQIPAVCPCAQWKDSKAALGGSSYSGIRVLQQEQQERSPKGHHGWWQQQILHGPASCLQGGLSWELLVAMSFLAQIQTLEVVVQ